MAIATVAAEDVAVELVALKSALVHLLWHLSGTTAEPDGMQEWADASPVPLDSEQREAAYRRSEDLETQMLASVNRFVATALTARAA